MKRSAENKQFRFGLAQAEFLNFLIIFLFSISQI
jgi:hypothetical protein